jgi:hypothetical protein
VWLAVRAGGGGWGGFTGPGRMQVGFQRGVAVAAISGHRCWRTIGPSWDACDRRRQLRRIGGVSDLDAVVEDDPVSVVNDHLRMMFLKFRHRLGFDADVVEHQGSWLRPAWVPNAIARTWRTSVWPITTSRHRPRRRSSAETTSPGT